MKILQIFLSLIAVLLAKTLSETKASMWKQFKIDFNKSFESSVEEELREKIFWESVKTISRHNFEFRKGRKSFKMGINLYGDMTFEEFSEMYKANETMQALARKKAKGITVDPDILFDDDYYNSTEAEREFPLSVDWRAQGAVTSVKNQNRCGSCYAMAAVGAIESHYFIKNQELHDFSVQEIVDCSGEYVTFGCAGGLAFRVFEYVKDNELSLASDYPYTSRDGECRPSDNKLKINLTGWGFVGAEFDSDILMEAVSKFGPLIVSIDIDHESFMRYSSGIYYDENCTVNVNHGALLVGYGSEDGEDYWLIKNSFGDAWGESGYIRMIRSKNMGNECGIRLAPAFPIIE